MDEPENENRQRPDGLPIFPILGLLAALFLCQTLSIYFIATLPDIGLLSAILINFAITAAVIAPLIYLFLRRYFLEKITAETGEQGSDILETMERIRTSFVEQDVIMKITSDGVMRIDTEGNIASINSAGCRMFGYEEGELEGESFDTILPEAKTAIMLTGYDSILEGWEYHEEEDDSHVGAMETVGRKKDGDDMVIELSTSGLMENMKYSYLVIMRDVSSRKQAETELLAAKTKAEDANNLKDKFVSLVSHDLKSPLTSTLGFLKLMLSNDESHMLTERQKTVLKTMEESGHRMTEMINDILDISRIKSGAIVPVRKLTNMRGLAGTEIMKVQQIAGNKGITITNSIPDDEVMYLDRALLGEAILNLLSNAIKFTNPGGSVEIAMGGGEEEKSISVSDSGVGLGDVTLEELLDYSVKTSTVGTGGEIGTGFGLPLSRDITEAHGGQITAAPREEGGTIFSIILPVARPLILLVDDEPNHRKMFSAYLKMEMNVEIEFCENGREALAYLERKIPSLIVADLMMPDIDGLDMLKVMRADERFDAIPVIILTASDSIAARQQAIDLDVADFILKSGDVDSVTNSVRAALS